MKYTCSPGLSGNGNISADPKFVAAALGDYRLRHSSPCLDAGDNGYAVGATDLAGNDRIQNSTIEMGAYEGSVAGNAISVTIVGRGEVSPAYAFVPVNGEATFNAIEDGRAFVRFLTNGVAATTAPNFTWRNISADSILTAEFAAQTYYADASRPDDSGDGLSWATAKQTLQAAIDLAPDGYGDTVRVADGIYAPITTANKSVAIHSVNGATATIIDGGGANRCATLGADWTAGQNATVLTGFTLRNGYSVANGGGVQGGTLYTCTISNNVASYWGGGAYVSILNNSLIVGNRANVYGGAGAEVCELYGCTIVGNTATGYGGGGASGSTLYNCIVWNNSDNGYGGAHLVNSTAYNSCSPGLSGNGNIGSDPQFVDAPNGDYRLMTNSPCFNSGDNSYAVGDVDLAGRPRISSGRVDMGAYELEFVAITMLTAGQGTLAATPASAQVLLGGDIAFTAAPDAGWALRYILTNGLFATSATNLLWQNIVADGELTAVFEMLPPVITLPEALDNTNLIWQTGGAAAWQGQGGITHDNSDAAQSGAIAHNQESLLQTIVEGPGEISFWWRVSSEAGWDGLAFYVDATEIDSITGDTVWQQKLIELPAGSHQLTWRYAKDPIDLHPTGYDCGWVDQVVYTRYSDRIPVAWLRQYTLALDGSQDDDDCDIDGFSSFEEWVAGSDPTDAHSHLQAEIRMEEGDVVIGWSPDLLGATPPRLYSIWHATNLQDEFTILTNSLPAGTAVRLQPGGVPSQFFRIGVELAE